MSLGSSLKATAKKHHSSRAWPAKVELRERALNWVGARKARVFDAFAGAGGLHRPAFVTTGPVDARSDLLH